MSGLFTADFILHAILRTTTSEDFIIHNPWTQLDKCPTIICQSQIFLTRGLTLNGVFKTL